MARLYRNAIFNLLGQGATLVFGLVLAKVVYRNLGEDALGVLYFAMTLAGLLSSVLDLGVSQTVTREVAVHVADDPKYIVELLQTATCLGWIGFAVGAALVWTLAPFLVHRWLLLGRMDTATAITVIRVLGVASVLALPRSVYSSMCRGVERMELNNGIDVFLAAAQQLGAVAILILGGGLLGVASWLAAGGALWVAAYLVVLPNLFPAVAFVPRLHTGAIKKNVAFARELAGISVLGVVHTQADRIIVSRLLPLGDLGVYSAAARVATRATAATAAIAQAAYPSVSESLARMTDVDARRRYRHLQDLICYGTLPVFAGVAFAALPLFEAVFDAGVAVRLVVPVVWLCVGHYMNAALNVPYLFCLAENKPKSAVRANFVVLFISLPSAVWLIQRYGIAGAGFSWAFFHALICVIWIPVVSTELGIESARAWFWRLSKVTSLGLFTYGTAWLALWSRADYSNGAIALTYVVATLGFAAGAYSMADDCVRQDVAKVFRVSFAWATPSTND